MHRKPVFVLAGIFLAVALIVPPVILLIQSDQDIDNYVTVQNNPGMVTAGNTTFIQEVNESHKQTSSSSPYLKQSSYRFF